MILLKTGSVTLENHKRGQRFLVIPEELLPLSEQPPPGFDVMHSESCNYQKIGKDVPVGGLLRIQLNEDGHALPSTERYLGLWPDLKQRTIWSAHERAYLAERDAEKRLAADKKADPVAELVAPLREVYWRLAPPARTQFIARVLHHLHAAGGKRQ